ncbi:MAG: TlpA disulfide reductase family protein [Burkholderiales bacterium]
MKKIFFLSLLLLPVLAAAQGFVLKGSDGQELRLADFKGKWVVVNFWAPWCPPCLEEIPDLVDAYDARKDKDLVVIGVAMDYEEKKEVLRLAESLMVSYPIVLDQRAVKTHFGVIKGLPTTWIYDPNGKLAKKFAGRISARQLAAITGG